jgi:hypothetical protein
MLLPGHVCLRRSGRGFDDPLYVDRTSGVKNRKYSVKGRVGDVNRVVEVYSMKIAASSC